MITAVDTCVLIDVFRNDPAFGGASADALRRCIHEGRLVICDVVWAELAALFPSPRHFEETLAQLPIDFSPMNAESASLAGKMWRQYHARGGTRSHIIPDFLIAAHAQVQCNRLLTRDRVFYRDYFKKLNLVIPTS